MFKKAELAWNARTPIWLHNGTKENLIFQLGFTVVLIGVMMAHDAYKDRRDFPSLHDKTNK